MSFFSSLNKKIKSTYTSFKSSIKESVAYYFLVKYPNAGEFIKNYIFDIFYFVGLSPEDVTNVKNLSQQTKAKILKGDKLISAFIKKGVESNTQNQKNKEKSTELSDKDIMSNKIKEKFKFNGADWLYLKESDEKIMFLQHLTGDAKLYSGVEKLWKGGIGFKILNLYNQGLIKALANKSFIEWTLEKQIDFDGVENYSNNAYKLFANNNVFSYILRHNNEFNFKDDENVKKCQVLLNGTVLTLIEQSKLSLDDVLKNIKAISILNEQGAIDLMNSWSLHLHDLIQLDKNIIDDLGVNGAPAVIYKLKISKEDFFKLKPLIRTVLCKNTKLQDLMSQNIMTIETIKKQQESLILEAISGIKIERMKFILNFFNISFDDLLTYSYNILKFLASKNAKKLLEKAHITKEQFLKLNDLSKSSNINDKYLPELISNVKFQDLIINKIIDLETILNLNEIAVWSLADSKETVLNLLNKKLITQKQLNLITEKNCKLIMDCKVYDIQNGHVKISDLIGVELNSDDTKHFNYEQNSHANSLLSSATEFFNMLKNKYLNKYENGKCIATYANNYAFQEELKENFTRLFDKVKEYNDKKNEAEFKILSTYNGRERICNSVAFECIQHIKNLAEISCNKYYQSHGEPFDGTWAQLFYLLHPAILDTEQLNEGITYEFSIRTLIVMLYEIERGNNINDVSNDTDDKPSSRVCPEGIFLKIMEFLTIIRKDSSMIFITNQSVFDYCFEKTLMQAAEYMSWKLDDAEIKNIVKKIENDKIITAQDWKIFIWPNINQDVKSIVTKKFQNVLSIRIYEYETVADAITNALDGLSGECDIEAESHIERFFYHFKNYKIRNEELKENFYDANIDLENINDFSKKLLRNERIINLIKIKLMTPHEIASINNEDLYNLIDTDNIINAINNKLFTVTDILNLKTRYALKSLAHNGIIECIKNNILSIDVLNLVINEEIYKVITDASVIDLLRNKKLDIKDIQTFNGFAFNLLKGKLFNKMFNALNLAYIDISAVNKDVCDVFVKYSKENEQLISMVRNHLISLEEILKLNTYALKLLWKKEILDSIGKDLSFESLISINEDIYKVITANSIPSEIDITKVNNDFIKRLSSNTWYCKALLHPNFIKIIKKRYFDPNLFYDYINSEESYTNFFNHLNLQNLLFLTNISFEDFRNLSVFTLKALRNKNFYTNVKNNIDTLMQLNDILDEELCNILSIDNFNNVLPQIIKDLINFKDNQWFRKTLCCPHIMQQIINGDITNSDLSFIKNKAIYDIISIRKDLAPEFIKSLNSLQNDEDLLLALKPSLSSSNEQNENTITQGNIKSKNAEMNFSENILISSLANKDTKSDNILTPSLANKDTKSDNILTQSLANKDTKSDNILTPSLANKDTKSDNILTQSLANKDTKSDNILTQSLANKETKNDNLLSQYENHKKSDGEKSDYDLEFVNASSKQKSQLNDF